MNDGLVSRFDWAQRHAGGVPVAFRAALVGHGVDSVRSMPVALRTALVRFGIDCVRDRVHLQAQAVLRNRLAVDGARKLFIDIAWHERRHRKALAAIGAKLPLVVLFVFLVASGDPHFIFRPHIPRFEVAV